MHETAPAPAEDVLGIARDVPGDTEPRLQHAHVGDPGAVVGVIGDRVVAEADLHGQVAGRPPGVLREDGRDRAVVIRRSGSVVLHHQPRERRLPGLDVAEEESHPIRERSARRLAFRCSTPSSEVQIRVLDAALELVRAPEVVDKPREIGGEVFAGGLPVLLPRAVHG